MAIGATMAVLVSLTAGGALEGGRVQTVEGWYQLEEGYGEAADSEAVIVADADPPMVAQAPAPGGEGAQARPAPPAAEPPQTLLLDDCDDVRGRYLQRVLELKGVSIFGLEPRLLAAWTRHRPLAASGSPLAGLYGLPDPALAPLYGDPPTPPGALSYDFTLQNLAQELLRCDNGAVPVQFGSP